MSLGQTLQRRKSFVPPAIQITSMMDMFTIIVFFLLFSYSENPDEFDIDAQLELPSSSSTINYDHALSVFLSENSIKLEDQVIGTIKGDQLEGYDMEQPAASDVAKAFLQFKQQSAADDVETSVAVDNPNGLDPSVAHILLFCDRDVPFKVINQVIKAASSAGYTNFQLAVMEQ